MGIDLMNGIWGVRMPFVERMPDFAGETTQKGRACLGSG